MGRLESLTGAMDLAFPEYDRPPEDPRPIFGKWLATARDVGVREPSALILATASTIGAPTLRAVVPIAVEDGSLWIATHRTSRKALDMERTGRAGGHYYWREIGRQFGFQAKASLAGDDVAQAAWNARSAAYDCVSAASRQSEPLPEPEALERQVEHLKHKGKLKKPQRFAVYRLDIEACEFWSATRSRIHKRLVYEKTRKGWRHERLQP